MQFVMKLVQLYSKMPPPSEPAILLLIIELTNVATRGQRSNQTGIEGE